MHHADRRHTRALETLANKPSIIGLDAIEVRVEQPVMNTLHDPFTDIDLLVRTPSGIVIVEYKLGGADRHARVRYENASEQLTKLGDRFDEVFGWRPGSIYVHGRFEQRLIERGTCGDPPDLEYVTRRLQR